MKEIASSVIKSLQLLSDSDIKESISVISSSELTQAKAPFVCVDKTLPTFSKFVKKSSSVAIVSSGENLTKLLKAPILNANYLTVIGLQEYLVEKKMIEKLNLDYVETLNLGEFKDDFQKCEPLLRECEYFIVDINSLKHSDCEFSTNPNGFAAEEFNQLAHYIGSSINLKGVFIIGLQNAKNICCNNLIAQFIWIIANSRAHNVIEDPTNAYKKNKYSSRFQHKIVNFNNDGESIVFISSLESGRLWMEIPIVKKNKVVLIPCSDADFQQAINDTIPNKWLMYYSKYNIL